MSVQSITSPVQVGQRASATLKLTNSGSASTSVSVNGIITLNGAATGNTFPTKTVSLAAGQSTTVTLQSANAMPTNEAGDTLGVKFTGSWS